MPCAMPTGERQGREEDLEAASGQWKQVCAALNQAVCTRAGPRFKHNPVVLLRQPYVYCDFT
jgi:hypothetical protein